MVATKKEKRSSNQTEAAAENRRCSATPLAQQEENLVRDVIKKKLPIGLKLAAIYLLIGGLIGLLMFIIKLLPEHSEFAAKSIGYKVGSYFRVALFNILSVVSGIGIFLRKAWARKLALFLLVITFPYAANEFAWGVAHGKPSQQLYLISLAASIIWNGIWFLLIFKRTSREALT